MSLAVDYDLTIREAEKALAACKSADDVRNAWRRYSGALGHRMLARLLMGRTADELIAKREASEKE